MRPRAKVLRRRCHDLLDALGQRDDPLLKLTMELEQIALEDDDLIERKLYPNVVSTPAPVSCAEYACRPRAGLRVSWGGKICRHSNPQSGLLSS